MFILLTDWQEQDRKVPSLQILSEQENIILQMLSVTFAGRKGKTCQTEKQTKNLPVNGLFLPFGLLSFWLEGTQPFALKRFSYDCLMSCSLVSKNIQKGAFSLCSVLGGAEMFTIFNL